MKLLPATGLRSDRCRSEKSGGAADVVFYFAVADMDGAVGEGRDVGFVGDEHDGVAGFVQALEQPHDLGAGFRVEVAGRLVGEQDRRVVDERAGDGDALTLTA